MSPRALLRGFQFRFGSRYFRVRFLQLRTQLRLRAVSLPRRSPHVPVLRAHGLGLEPQRALRFALFTLL